MKLIFIFDIMQVTFFRLKRKSLRQKKLDQHLDLIINQYSGIYSGILSETGDEILVKYRMKIQY